MLKIAAIDFTLLDAASSHIMLVNKTVLVGKLCSLQRSILKPARNLPFRFQKNKAHLFLPSEVAKVSEHSVSAEALRGGLLVRGHCIQPDAVGPVAVYIGKQLLVEPQVQVASVGLAQEVPGIQEDQCGCLGGQDFDGTELCKI